MKTSACIAMLIVVGLLFLPTRGEDTTTDLGSEMTQYFVGLIYRGDNWTPEVTEETKQLQKGHLARISQLVASGKMVLAGPFGHGGDLRGLFFYNVKTKEEARQLADSDPAVKAGRLRVDLHPWWGPRELQHPIKKGD